MCFISEYKIDIFKEAEEEDKYLSLKIGKISKSKKHKISKYTLLWWHDYQRIFVKKKLSL